MLNVDLMNTPTQEINRMIKWLEFARNDCDLRIAELERLKQNRQRSCTHRKTINELALEIYNSDKEFLSKHNQYEATLNIQKQLLCSWPRARQTYDVLKKWATNKKRRDRNEQIIILANSGMNKTNIADKFQITRQQVYNVLRKNKKSIFLKN